MQQIPKSAPNRLTGYRSAKRTFRSARATGSPAALILYQNFELLAD